MLLGAKENKSDCSALKDYFISQPAINITSCTSSAIEFVASGYLDLYDKDYVENMLSNKNSYIFSIDCSFNKSDIKEILKAIFVDEKYKIRTQAQFILQSDPLRIKAIRGAINGDRNVVVPNPHLDGHGCMGGNDVLVATAIKNRDVQTMLDIAVSSTHNINFADSIVVTTFIRYLASHQNTSFLQDEDGVCVTVSQLLEAERKAERCRAELN
jgi:ribosomal protein L23